MKLLKPQPDGWWGDEDEDSSSLQYMPMYVLVDVVFSTHPLLAFLKDQKNTYPGGKKIEADITWDNSTYSTYGDLKKTTEDNQITYDDLWELYK